MGWSHRLLCVFSGFGVEQEIAEAAQNLKCAQTATTAKGVQAAKAELERLKAQVLQVGI